MPVIGLSQNESTVGASMGITGLTYAEVVDPTVQQDLVLSEGNRS